jgi:hypothetical protein
MGKRKAPPASSAQQTLVSSFFNPGAGGTAGASAARGRVVPNVAEKPEVCYEGAAPVREARRARAASTSLFSFYFPRVGPPPEQG